MSHLGSPDKILYIPNLNASHVDEEGFTHSTPEIKEKIIHPDLFDKWIDVWKDEKIKNRLYREPRLSIVGYKWLEEYEDPELDPLLESTMIHTTWMGIKVYFVKWFDYDIKFLS